MKKTFYLKACIQHEWFNINFLCDKKKIICKLTAAFGKYFMNGTKLPYKITDWSFPWYHLHTILVSLRHKRESSCFIKADWSLTVTSWCNTSLQCRQHLNFIWLFLIQCFFVDCWNLLHVLIKICKVFFLKIKYIYSLIQGKAICRILETGFSKKKILHCIGQF